MSCGRDNAAAVDIENGESLYAFETEINLPSHYRSLNLCRCWHRHRHDFLITLPGKSDDAARARELDEQPREVLDLKRSGLLTKNTRSVRAS